MEDKKLFWSLRIALGVLGVMALYQIVPYFIKMLNALVILYRLTEETTTPEFRFLLICLGLWVNLTVFTTITNLVFKLHSLLEDKIFKTKETQK